jgi:hypothetical protein
MSKSPNAENSKCQMVLKMFHLRENIGIVSITDRIENDAALFGQLRLTIKHLHLVESCPGNGKRVYLFLSISPFVSLPFCLPLSSCLSDFLSFCLYVLCLSVFLSLSLSFSLSVFLCLHLVESCPVNGRMVYLFLSISV